MRIKRIKTMTGFRNIVDVIVIIPDDAALNWAEERGCTLPDSLTAFI